MWVGRGLFVEGSCFFVALCLAGNSNFGTFPVLRRILAAMGHAAHGSTNELSFWSANEAMTPKLTIPYGFPNKFHPVHSHMKLSQSKQ